VTVNTSVCVCVCVIVNCKVSSRAVSKSPINPITNPNPVYIHSISALRDLMNLILHFLSNQFSITVTLDSRIYSSCSCLGFLYSSLQQPWTINSPPLSLPLILNNSAYMRYYKWNLTLSIRWDKLLHKQDFRFNYIITRDKCSVMIKQRKSDQYCVDLESNTKSRNSTIPCLTFSPFLVRNPRIYRRNRAWNLSLISLHNM
jgi:hypothetical protein